MASILWQGDYYRLNSFAIVNRHLIAAIKKLGYEITVAPTDRYVEIELEPSPDIYIFHNFPYDVIQVPGNFNIFYLPYEYFEFYDRDYFLAEGINAKFDLMVVPSEFTKKACENSGVKIPIRVISEGFDPQEFNPHVPPTSLETEKKFRFLNLGGAFFRKGHDLLINAYLDEFTHDDDVVLVIKAFSYHQEIDWFKEILATRDQMEHPPEILFEYSELKQVGGYYTATDVGVYPYRGEGFGLTILESIASGCPVIVTEGGSTDDFCDNGYARFINSSQKETDGQIHLEPDANHLRELMRQAYHEGKTSFDKREDLHQTSLAFTWDESAKKWASLFREILDAKKSSLFTQNSLEASAKVSLIFSDYDDQISPWKEYTPQQKRIDTISPWKASKAEIVAALSKSIPNKEIIHLSRNISQIKHSETIVGNSGYSYEIFVHMKKLKPDTKIILFHDEFPIDLSMELEFQERERLGIKYREQPRYQSLLHWRYKQEIKMANEIILLDSISKKYFSQKYDPMIAHSVTPPIPQRSFQPPPNDKTTFLFWGFDPFRRGIRILFEAWHKLQLKNAELLCVLETQIALASKQLIKYLVLNPTIKVLELWHSPKYIDYLSNCDVQVLPSLGDGFFLPAAIGLSMGRPLITTDQSGMKDIVQDHEFGYISKANDVDSLEKGILHYYEMSQAQRNEIGRSSSHYIEKYTKENFANQILKVLTDE